jgi:hypothetical protein
MKQAGSEPSAVERERVAMKDSARETSRSRRTSDENDMDFFPDDSEVARLVREFDWAATPLGPLAQWSASLRMIVRFLLANRFPMLLWWGPDYIQIYNDHYVPVLGTKHPREALGKPFRECWHEVYDVLGPLVDTPFNGGPATWKDDIELIVHRRGFNEESHFTIAYSPVPDETAPRGIGGVLAVVIETTEKVISQRRVGVLSHLGAGIADTKTDVDACTVATKVLGQYPKDMPFALVYLLDNTGHELQLVSSTGIEAELAGPEILDASGPMSEVVWPLAEALRTETIRTREGLAALMRSVPQGPWPYAPDAVAVVPIRSNVAGRPAGALVVGISACIRLDQLYMSFLSLVGSQISTAVANARAYEEERRRSEALTEADRQKNEFLAMLAHELRNPLAPIRNANQLLSRKFTADPDASWAVAMVNRQVTHLTRLVDDLLDISRITQGRIDLRRSPTPV